MTDKQTQRSHDIGVATADLVERSGKEPNVVSIHVRLGANPVVLVLDHKGRRHCRDDIRCGGKRLSQHEAQWVKQCQCRLTKLIMTRQ